MGISPADGRADDVGVSIRDCVLIGPELGPPPFDPVRVERVERGELEVGHPLGARHVAVEPGHQHPDREAVGQRERLPVHGHREHRVPAVHDHRGGRAGRPPVHRPGHELVRAGVDARLLEEVGERGADPPGVADVPAAHRVRDTGQRDVALDERAGQELLVVERDLAVDHAVDRELPGLGHDGRDEERRVHPVERAVRGEERAHARHVHLDIAGARGRAGWPGDADRGPRVVGPEPPGEQVPRPTGHDGDCRPRCRGEEEPAAVHALWPLDRVSLLRGRPPGHPNAERPQQQDERRGPRAGTDQGRERVDGRRLRPGQGGGHPDHGKHPQPGKPDHRAPNREPRPGRSPGRGARRRSPAGGPSCPGHRTSGSPTASATPV